MAKMDSIDITVDLLSNHSVRVIGSLLDTSVVTSWTREGWPSCSTIEFVFAWEKDLARNNRFVKSFVFVVPVGIVEWWLSSTSDNLLLERGQVFLNLIKAKARSRLWGWDVFLVMIVFRLSLIILGLICIMSFLPFVFLLLLQSLPFFLFLLLFFLLLFESGQIFFEFIFVIQDHHLFVVINIIQESSEISTDLIHLGSKCILIISWETK